MPDERLFHLALGHSNKVNQLTDFERWVWAIYKLASDDFGVMRFSPTPLKEAADFLEAKSDRLVQRGLEVVRDVGLILTFEHQGRVYCFQRDWQTWQKITHPRATMQPAPPLDAVDLNTQWLLTLHPKGGKLTSWQHPDNRKKTGSIPEVVPENSGSSPEVLPKSSRKTSEVLPEKSGPVFVDVGVDVSRVGVGGRGRVDAAPPAVEANARSKRPVFTCTRFAVFEWQLDDLRKMLGPHVDDFDLHEWFFTLSAKADAAGIVVPQRDGGKWLAEQTLVEAERRGLPVATTQTATGKTASNLNNLQRFAAKGAAR